MPVSSNREAGGQAQAGVRGKPPIAKKSKGPISGNGGDGASRIDFSNSVVGGIGDVEVAAIVDDYARRRIQLGFAGIGSPEKSGDPMPARIEVVPKVAILRRRWAAVSAT